VSDNFNKFIKTVGNKIKTIRISQGLTQEDMEEGSYGISYRTVQDIENGKSNTSLRSIYKIAKRLGIEPKDILDVPNEDQ